MNNIRIRKVNGSWFVYTETRVLGPFRFYKQAVKALLEYDAERRDEV
jgi:hypothetical protein